MIPVRLNKVISLGVAAISLLLSGCVKNPYVAAPITNFSPKSENGLLIFGVSNLPLNHARALRWQRVEAGSVQVDRETGWEKAFAIFLDLSGEKNEDLMRIKYRAIVLPPGDYALGWIQVALSIHDLWPNTWKVRVEPGTAIYAGDFRFESPEFEILGMIWPDPQRATIRFAGTNEEGARNFLSTIKNVTAPMIVRPATLTSFNILPMTQSASVPR